MTFSDVKLPSNKKFGFFFTSVFAIATGYFFMIRDISLAYILASTTVVFCTVTVVRADFLLPLNKLWMRFGLFLGMIINPIVLGVLFFGVFTPIAFVMRLRGRDELRLKFKKETSYWISRNEPIKAESFKQQF
jgi:hypothetical protein